jgi:hypothetical protein
MKRFITSLMCVGVLASGMPLGCGKEQPPSTSTPRAPSATPPPKVTFKPSTRPADSPAPTATQPSAAPPTSVRPTTQAATAPTEDGVITTSPPGKPPGDPKVATFAGLSAPKPVTWLWQPPSNKMILSEYVVPGRDGADQARIAVIPAGGTVEQNIERWKGQFRNKEGGPVEPTRVHKVEADGMPITLVEFAGDYRGMSGVFSPDQLFITAIVEAPTGQIFIRFVGPSATVETNRQPFMEMIQGIKQVEAEK